MVEQGNVDNPHKPGEKWPTTETSVPDFWRFLTGASGEAGPVPHIGEDGFWYVGDKKTDVKAQGEKGENGEDATPPVVTITKDGFWAVNGEPTDKTANPTDGKDGKNGKTPTITINPQTGNWVINGEETNTPAKGKDGKTPAVTISKDGKWVVDGKETEHTAFGNKGGERRERKERQECL